MREVVWMVGPALLITMQAQPSTQLPSQVSLFEETMDPRDQVLNWFAAANEAQRLSYLKELLSCCPLGELKPLQSILNNTKKRKSPFPRNYAKKLKLREANGDGDGGEGVPESTHVVPEPPSKPEPKCWWEIFNEDDIVAMDCEMVHLHKTDGAGKHILEAATVSIVKLDGTEIYQVNYCVIHNVKHKIVFITFRPGFSTPLDPSLSTRSQEKSMGFEKGT